MNHLFLKLYFNGSKTYSNGANNIKTCNYYDLDTSFKI